MIEIKDLTKRYGEILALDSISFEVRAGEVVGFLGPNGAGKTTTLRILTCFLPPTSGSVRVAGLALPEGSLEVRALIGYLPENNPLYGDMEVLEYLTWGARMRGLSGPDSARAVRRAVERCGVGPVVGRDIDELSKGYRQRVGFAHAILHDPPILLLDEPTSGLDPNQARTVMGLIQELKKEKTVMLSSHILPEVQASCDRVVIIHKGRIAAQGSPSELAGGARPRIVLVLKAGKVHGPEASEALRGLEGVDEVEARTAGGELLLSIMQKEGEGDLRPEVFRLAAGRKWPVLELRREGASLDEIFRQLTLN